MAPSTEATANKPFTVIGYWDDSDTAIAVGVVDGHPGFAGSANVSEGGAWAIDVEAPSYEQAETLGTQQMQSDFDARVDADEDDEADDADDESDSEDDEDEDGETGKVFEFDHNDRVYEVDFGGETYAIYDDENKQIAFFDYYGDRDNHLSIEEAAIKALEALGR